MSSRREEFEDWNGIHQMIGSVHDSRPRHDHLDLWALSGGSRLVPRSSSVVQTIHQDPVNNEHQFRSYTYIPSSGSVSTRATGSTSTPRNPSLFSDSSARGPSSTTTHLPPRIAPHLTVGLEPTTHTISSGPGGAGAGESRLWCAFVFLHKCRRTYGLDEVREWIDHHATYHLDERYPAQVMCWFCDHVPFKAETWPGARRNNFVDMMEHVRQHIFDEYLTKQDLRIDFHLVNHLWNEGLLDEATYNRAMSFSELPRPVHDELRRQKTADPRMRGQRSRASESR